MVRHLQSCFLGLLAIGALVCIMGAFVAMFGKDGGGAFSVVVILAVAAWSIGEAIRGP